MFFACNNDKQIQALAFIGGLNKEHKLFKPFISVQPQEYSAGLTINACRPESEKGSLDFWKTKPENKALRLDPLVENGNGRAISP